jgi:2-polyprenyl-6-methoxyphenol hydroxylase-like FAD-dependent oxidoreductase
MATYDFDVITVGGGLGGAALARTLAMHGLRVLVTERERHFKDRIRGEWMAPWGVAETKKLGIYDLLRETCAHEQPFFHFLGFGPTRDFTLTTLQQLPAFTLYHPAMQEVLLDAARTRGAEVWRGATVRQVRPGAKPEASVEKDGTVHELTARLVVCADGRSSMGRTWGGFSQRRGPQRLLGAGVLFEDVTIPDDTSLGMFVPGVRRVPFLFPQGDGRVRAYLMYDPEEVSRLQGEADVARFIDESVRTGMPADCYRGARAIGPLASFDLTETWVDHPFRDGLALIGDAAGSSDPTYGQGLSLTSRDARVLGENLLASDDWSAAGHAYATERDHYFGAMLRSEDWQSHLFFAQGPEADAIRTRALPLISQDPTRYPDHGFSGPDLPCDDSVRRRFFGED